MMRLNVVIYMLLSAARSLKVTGLCEYNTTLRPQTERYCNYGYAVCLHGHCDSWTQPCTCDPNWTGGKCENLLCPIECNGNCELCGDIINCLQPDFTVSSIVTSESAKSTWTETTIISTTTTTTPPPHVCSQNYTLRPRLDRYCNGLFCKYGKCITTHQGYKRCSCDPGATGDICEKKCCKYCGEGFCLIINGTELCDWENPDGVGLNFGKNNEEETWYWWVVGVCLGLTVLLVLTLIILPYWMWRNRVILIMKIVHYFQGYEDNDERVWDAFVSYKSDGDDEIFVVQQLYPKLELDLGFKLCLHFRDFIPGDAIANNIINAVTNSRRTILVLSPRYIQSEWTKYEYQHAQQQMLQKRHRIIPIVLGDISAIQKDMDPNLKQILNSFTYIEWPDKDFSTNLSKAEKFWSRLTLSMPKRRVVEDHRKAKTRSSIFSKIQDTLPLTDKNSIIIREHKIKAPSQIPDNERKEISVVSINPTVV